jgi:hypothetical protein
MTLTKAHIIDTIYNNTDLNRPQAIRVFEATMLSEGSGRQLRIGHGARRMAHGALGINLPLTHTDYIRLTLRSRSIQKALAAGYDTRLIDHRPYGRCQVSV